MRKILLALSVLLFTSCASADKQHMKAIFDMYGAKVQGTQKDGGLVYEFDLDKLPIGVMSKEFMKRVSDKTDSFTDSFPTLDELPTRGEDGTFRVITEWQTPQYYIGLVYFLNNDKDIHKMTYHLVVK